ncbi:hypothetical protein BER93_18940 [Xanthomonas fragariae]|nr:hypothetical protein BER92_18890 [Xanthomonas fragariae]AOD19783.1 hypothetical protein BER93_18940 [Xanthomonas fragariae]
MPRSVGSELADAPPGAGHASGVLAGPAQVQRLDATQFRKQDLMQAIPTHHWLAHTQPAPATPAKEYAGAQDIDDAVEGGLIADTRPSAVGDHFTCAISSPIRFQALARTPPSRPTRLAQQPTAR